MITLRLPTYRLRNLYLGHQYSDEQEDRTKEERAQQHTRSRTADPYPSDLLSALQSLVN